MESTVILSLINGLIDLVIRIGYMTERLREIADMDDENVKLALDRARMETEALLKKLD